MLPFPDGPRDWSPRMDWPLRMIERIRAVIPKEMLIEEGAVLNPYGFMTHEVGQIYNYAHFEDGVKVRSQNYKVMFLVKFKQEVEEVCLGDKGAITLGVSVSQLLDGLLPGYEYMGDINPFKNP